MTTTTATESETVNETANPQVSDSAHVRHTPAHTPPHTPGQDGPPPLTKPMKTALGGLAAGSGALAGMAFVGMFSAVRAAVRPWAHKLAWTIPVGTDLGIIILSAIAIWLEWAQKGVPAEKRLKLWWLRGLIWILIGLQLGINIGSANGNLFGSAVHAVLPVLFISILEVWQFIIRWRRGLVADRGPKAKRDRIPLARYRADWSGTREIRRHMILWGVNSYERALDMLQQKRRAEASLRVMFPDSSDKPPQDLVFMLGTARYLDDACAEIARLRKKYDQGVTPKGETGRRIDNIVSPGEGGKDRAAGAAPGCCEAHRALALKQILPLEKAATVNDGHIAAHGSAIGADNLRLLFKVGTPRARQLRDDLKASRGSGHRSGGESGSASGSGPAPESGQGRVTQSGGQRQLAAVGSANGNPTESGDAR